MLNTVYCRLDGGQSHYCVSVIIRIKTVCVCVCAHAHRLYRYNYRYAIHIIMHITVGCKSTVKSLIRKIFKMIALIAQLLLLLDDWITCLTANFQQIQPNSWIEDVWFFFFTAKYELCKNLTELYINMFACVCMRKNIASLYIHWLWSADFFFFNKKVDFRACLWAGMDKIEKTYLFLYPHWIHSELLSVAYWARPDKPTLTNTYTHTPAGWQW